MKVLLLFTGKTDKKYITEGIDLYQKRISRYLPFGIKILPDIKNTKNLSADQQKEKEGQVILQNLYQDDYIVLLDEKGTEYSSAGFSGFLQQKMLTGLKQVVFIIGGAYGFSKEIYDRADHQLSLSKMTFSHQMVRLVFVEQFYRAMTILKGEPYHHG